MWSPSLKSEKPPAIILADGFIISGEGEIRTHATVARPNAFRVRPLITTWVLLHN